MSKKQKTISVQPQQAVDHTATIASLQEKIQELENNWKRALADYQNLIKRTESDKRDFMKFAAVTILAKLIPALDLLEMAAAHSDDQGLRLAVKNFQEVLMSENVQEIAPHPGDAFDAAAHECTETVTFPLDTFDGAQAPPFRAGKKAPLSVNPEQALAFSQASRRVDESVKENTIAEMVLKGYKIDTFVIRPAKVKVYKTI